MALLSLKKKKTRHSFEDSRDEVEQAIHRGITSFFTAQRAEIGTFVSDHFQYPGCWRTNRYGFGLDLLRAPLNLFWAPIYVVTLFALWLLSVLGWQKAKRVSSRLPGGMVTRVQRNINEKVRLALLDTQKLKACIVNELQALPETQNLSADKRLTFTARLEVIIEQALKQLMLTRTASADIANTLFTTTFGALAFNKFTPGGIGIGLLLATFWVTKRAEDTFIFGPAIGGWYYKIFPPQADWLTQASAVALAMLILAVIASFSGLITDPIQSKLGLHQRRLTKMLNQLEQDLVAGSSNRFKPMDPYIARILDLLDTLKANAHF